MIGDVSTSVVLADSSRIVDRTDRPEPRQESIDQFVTRIQHVLDRHLTDLGRDGGGALSHLRADRVPGIAPTLTSELASPEMFVVNAVYEVTVGHSGHPQWAEVIARLVRSDGSTTAPTLVFIANDAREPRLVAWEASVTIPEPTPSSSRAPSSPTPTGAP